jgi:hypothetical protein
VREVIFQVFLGFFYRNFRETSHLALSMRALQMVSFGCNRSILKRT